MKSTGEVMGISEHFPIAFAKSQLAAGTLLPQRGTVFLSVSDRSKDHVTQLARRLEKMGFELLATKGTAMRLQQNGVMVQALKKLQEGHPNVLDYVIDGNLHLVINTPSGKGAEPTKAAFARQPCRTVCPASRRSKLPRRRLARWKPSATKR